MNPIAILTESIEGGSPYPEFDGFKIGDVVSFYWYSGQEPIIGVISDLPLTDAGKSYAAPIHGKDGSVYSIFLFDLLLEWSPQLHQRVHVEGYGIGEIVGECHPSPGGIYCLVLFAGNLTLPCLVINMTPL